MSTKLTFYLLFLGILKNYPNKHQNIVQAAFETNAPQRNYLIINDCIDNLWTLRLLRLDHRVKKWTIYIIDYIIDKRSVDTTAWTTTLFLISYSYK